MRVACVFVQFLEFLEFIRCENELTLVTTKQRLESGRFDLVDWSYNLDNLENLYNLDSLDSSRGGTTSLDGLVVHITSRRKKYFGKCINDDILPTYLLKVSLDAFEIKDKKRMTK